MRKNNEGKTVLNFDDFVNYLYENVSSIRTKKDADLIGRYMINFFHEKLSEGYIIEIKKLFTMGRREFQRKSGVLNVKASNRKFVKGKGVSFENYIKKIPYNGKPYNRIYYKTSKTLIRSINENNFESNNEVENNDI